MSTPTCRIHEKFFWIKCPLPAWEGDSEGLCILHSPDENKDQEGFDIAFGEKLEVQEYNFRKVFFPGPINFSRHEFLLDADFSGAIFNDEVDFGRATFNGDAIFFKVTFRGDAKFYSAIFKHWTAFTQSTFLGSAGFAWANFSGAINFDKVNFNGRTSFSGATIKGWLVFQAINYHEKLGRAQPFIGVFRYLKFLDRGVLRFQDLSLAQVQFAETDLRRVEFRHVAWHSYRGRQAIYDELILRQKELSTAEKLVSIKGIVTFALEIGSKINEFLTVAPLPPKPPTGNEYGEVERLYRNLKMNYIAEGDNKNAGDFHYGEMEMHRRASKWRWCPVYFYNLYWFLSGYGERPLRALGWLAAFLAIFTGLLAWVGLDLVPPHVPAFGDSFFYLLQKVTLQRPTWADPIGFGGKLVAGFSVLFIPGQAALFLLALRNRLGRRR
jgi:uncharacterized protein YjbI with pentapeptide repeats